MRRFSVLPLLLILLSSGAFAETDKTPCMLAKLGEVELQAAPSGVFQIPAKIRDETVAFIIDTGSQQTMIDEEMADRLSLPRGSQWGHYMRGASGAAAAEATTIIPEMSIGGATVRNARLHVALGTRFSRTANGLLGSDFLDQFDFEFDIADRKLRFFRQSHCADASSGGVYWADRYSEIPIAVRSEHLTIPVTLNGRQLTAMLDSGASTTTLAWTVANQMGITADSAGLIKRHGVVQAIGAQLDVFSYPFDELRIAGETIQKPVLSISDLRMRDADLILGADFIAAHRLYIATADRVLYFTWNGRTDFARPPR